VGLAAADLHQVQGRVVVLAQFGVRPPQPAGRRKGSSRALTDGCLRSACRLDWDFDRPTYWARSKAPVGAAPLAHAAPQVLHGGVVVLFEPASERGFPASARKLTGAVAQASPTPPW